MSNWHRWQIGFMSASEVQTVAASGTYRVATAEIVGGTPRIVRIPQPAGDYYYLEFRQPYSCWDNFSSSATVVNGVTIRIAPDVSKIIESHLIDTNPQTSTFSDAALAVGRTFSDLVNQIFITTTAIDPSGATVAVHLGPDTTPPTQPPSISASLQLDRVGPPRLDAVDRRRLDRRLLRVARWSDARDERVSELHGCGGSASADALVPGCRRRSEWQLERRSNRDDLRARHARSVRAGKPRCPANGWKNRGSELVARDGQRRRRRLSR